MNFTVGQQVLVRDGQGYQVGEVVEVHKAQILVKVQYTIKPSSGKPYYMATFTQDTWGIQVKPL